MIQDKAKKYYKMYRDAIDFHSDRFDEYKEATAYYELTQDSLRSTAAKPWVYQINTPYSTDAINLRVASLQASDYSGELEPLSPEDVETVRILNNVYKEVWRRGNHDDIVDEAIVHGAVLGSGYVHTIYDAEKTYGGTNTKTAGTISSYILDAASVNIDPKARSLETADYVAITERVTRATVEREYPNFVIPTPKGSFGDTTAQDRGEIYADNKFDTENDEDVYTKITIYEKVGSSIEKTVLLETKILVPTEKMLIRVFPITQFIWQKRLRSPYGTSLMSHLLPLQKVLNEMESANANANMQYSSPSYVLSEDSGIDPEAFAMSAGAPAVVYSVASTVDIDKVVRPLIPNRGIDQGIVVTKQELERAIYKLAGITDAFQGSLGTAANTASGTDMTIERAKMIEQRIIENIAEFVRSLSTVIIEFIVNGYDEKTVYTKGEKKSDGTFDFKAFTLPSNMAQLNYDFTIELNARTHYSKSQQKQQIMDLFQYENQYMDPAAIKAINTLDVLKVLNIPQQEEIIERYVSNVKMDAEQKAMLISEMVGVAQELGIDPQLLNAAISDVISNAMEKPNLDAFEQEISAVQMQQEQQVQGMMDLVNQQVNTQLTEQEVLEEQALEESGAVDTEMVF